MRARVGRLTIGGDEIGRGDGLGEPVCGVRADGSRGLERC